MGIAWVLVRLKLALLRAGLETAGIHGRLGAALALVLGLAFGFLGGFLLLAVRLLDPVDATDATCAGLGLLFMLWVFGPIVASSSDGTLDPDRLAPFPLTRAQLMPGLLLGALVGFGGLVSVLCLTGTFVGMAPASPLIVITLAGVVVHLFLCASASRLVGTVISGAARSRRWRDIALVAGPLIAVGTNVGLQLVTRSFAEPGSREVGDVGGLRVTARVLGGPAGLAIGMARQGRPTEAFAALLVAVVLLGTLLIGWAMALERVMTSDGGSKAARTSDRTSPLRPRLVAWLLPGGRLGAVAAKELRLLWRDPRQRVNLFGALFGAAVPFFSLRVLSSASPRLALVAAVPAFVLGTQATNQFGYDGPAHWVSVATGDDPRPELLGKNLARVLVAFPVVLATLAFLTLRSGDAGFVVPALGLAIAAYGTAVGLGNWFSVVSAIPLPESRTNVFSAGNTGQGLAAAGPAMATLVGCAVLLSPLVLLLVLVDGRPALQLLGLVGVLVGASVWTVGTRAAVRHWRPRQPELLGLLSSRA